MLGAEGAFERTIRINIWIITCSSGSGILMDSAVHMNRTIRVLKQLETECMALPSP
jgi:hypothetical protein